MQYSTGRVDVTNGSTSIVGTGTAWLANVSDGDLFALRGKNYWYEVASVVDDTHLSLTAPIASPDATNQQYLVSRSFTPGLGIPYPEDGDLQTASLFKRAVTQIEQVLQAMGAGAFTLTVPAGGTGQTTFPVGGLLFGNGTAALTSGTAMAKGSVLVGQGVGVNPIELAVGANGKVLAANSATASGLEWILPAGTASSITNVPAGNISATDVQAAINELDTEKLAASAVSSFGLTLIGATTAASARTTLGLGTAAVLNVGTGANQIPQLDGSGLLPTAVLPPLAITNVSVVASQSAMLALTAERGDVAVRSDINTSFVLGGGGNPATLSDWIEILSPGGAGSVTSVNGQTATVSLVLASTDFTSQGTVHAVLHGNATSAPSWGAVDLTADVSGYLPTANGGIKTGGTTGQMLRKASGTNGDAVWEDAPMALTLYFDGVPTANARGRVMVTEACVLPAGATGSGFYAKDGATANTTLTLNKISGVTTTAVGSLVVSTGGSTATITVGSDVNLAALDMLEVLWPGTPDATLGSAAIALRVKRS